MAGIILQSKRCESGGTGRRTRFRFWRRKACWFESLLSHHELLTSIGRSMAATLENIGQLERRLNITLPTVEIEDEVQSRLKRLARDVKMRGFRPGKVPLRVVAKQYEDQVRREVLGDALQKSFGDAIREQNLRVAGYPRFEPRTASADTPQVEFSATFEIYPEIAVGDLSAAVITRPVITIGEAEVDRTIEIMRKQRATYEPAARAAAFGDK